MYDSTCKFIATEFSEDIASWLLGQRISLTELKPSELSVEPIRADSVIFYFQVIRLWEIPSESFLQYKGLLPFAVLSQTENKENILRQVANKIEEVEVKRQKSNLVASTAILAGLVLNKDTIKLLFKDDIMKESVIYQEILAEGETKGRREGEINLILRQLNRRFGQLAPNFQSQIQNLSVEKLEDLAEVLLDFQTEDDLKQWLEKV